MTLIDLACGNWYTQMLSVICRLRIPDILHEKSLTAEEIARLTDTNANSIYRLMRALVSKGIFSQEGDLFLNNDISRMLTSDHPSCMYHYCMMRGSYYQYHSWSNLMFSIKTGRSALNHTLGISMFEYLNTHPEERIHFDSAMAGISRMIGKEIGEMYKSNTRTHLFSAAKTIVDIGGGNGTLLDTLLSSLGGLKGVVIDIERPQSFTQNRDISFVQGSFFNRIDTCGDIYLLKYILHDWGDEDCVLILKNIRDAIIHSGGKLLVIESIIDDESAQYHKLLDLQMMVCLQDGARERTYREYSYLFSLGGFSIVETVPLKTLGLSIMICSPQE